jgi:hypothetical protein
MLDIARTKCRERILGRALFLRSHRVVLEARDLFLNNFELSSISFGLTRSFLTARACELASSASSALSSFGFVGWLRSPYPRQTFRCLPSRTEVSGFRSQARGTLGIAMVAGSRKVASVSRHVCSKVDLARFLGEKAIHGDGEGTGLPAM